MTAQNLIRGPNFDPWRALVLPRILMNNWK